MATFTWDCIVSSRRNMTPRVALSQFGDGYSQRVADGINPQLPSWDLQFRMTASVISAIDDFLKARGGVEAFDWIAPDSTTTQKYLCSAWDKEPMPGGVAQINATFRRVAEA